MMKRRIWALMLALSLLLPMGALAAESVNVKIDTGATITLVDSDSDNLYEIGSADELYAFAALVKKGNRKAGGELTADIVVNAKVLKSDYTLIDDPSGLREWTPIGVKDQTGAINEGVNRDIPFTGTFDGNGHTVSGLYINDTKENFIGFFGNANGATIQNVYVKDTYFLGKKWSEVLSAVLREMQKDFSTTARLTAL